MIQYNNISSIIHREGYIFIIICAVLAFVFSSLSTNLGWIGLIATIWCGYFFRNPERVTPMGDDLVISAADGIVQQITEDFPPAELSLSKEKMLRISVFLSVFDVHVNRVPISGKIIALNYRPGKFLNASLDKASVDNERQSVLLESKNGTRIVFVQIAGLIARRIVCALEEDQEVLGGERFGIIRFGSRVDIYLPVDTVLNVSEGQRCIGGETIIADLSSKSKQIKELEFIKRK